MDPKGSVVEKSGTQMSTDFFRNSSIMNSTDDVCIAIGRAKKTVTEFPLASRNEYHKNDFTVISLLGKGAYAKVVKANLLKNNTLKAIKVIEKNFMERERKLYQIYLENEILYRLDHPNIVKIEGTFEENEKIYIVLEYIANGDFFQFIKDNAPLKFETAQFYTAQVVNALEFLHSKGVSHRDLKPENIDFATAKIDGMIFDKDTMKFEPEHVYIQNHAEDFSSSDDEPGDHDNFNKVKIKRGNTFVGTAEFVSPEVLMDKTSGPEVDLWALGCIIFQMFSGTSPFKDKTEYLIFKKVLENKIEFPDDFPPQAVDLITKLLIKDPSQRLGAGKEGDDNDFAHLKSHEFFKGVDFETLFTSEPPFKSEFVLKSSKKETPNDVTVTPKETYSQVPTPIFRVDLNKIIVLKQDVIDKKSPWFHYNTRKIVLDSTPKMEYIDPVKNIVKGVIYLSKDCTAQVVDNTIFELFTPKRVFKFRTRPGESTEWTKVINEAIDEYAKK